MKRTNNDTQERLESALDRILSGNTDGAVRRRLSVSAVEREAGMGSGSAYYYPEIISKLKGAKKALRQEDHQVSAKVATIGVEKDIRIVEKYRQESVALRERMSQMATHSHQQANALVRALKELQIAKENLTKYRREALVQIRPIPVAGVGRK
jgi:hypothetical protein